RSALDAKQFKPHDRMIDRLLDQGYASTDICSVLIHLLQSSSGSTGGTPAKGAEAKPATGWSKAAKPVKAAPAWAEKKLLPKQESAAQDEPEANPETGDSQPPRKAKFDRPARTGREAGMATL